MTNYREILRLHSQGLSQRSIAAICGRGKGTVQRTVEHAKKHNLAWPLPSEMTDARLRDLFSPSSKDYGLYGKIPTAGDNDGEGAQASL